MADVKSFNRLQVVGTVSELNFKKETKEVTLKGNGKEKKVTCQSISKEDFRNPNIIVEVDINGTVGAIGGHFYPTHEKKLNDKGEIIDNPRFKALETIMDYELKKTRVKMDGSLSANEYVTKDTFDFKTFPQISIFQCTSSGVPEEDIAEGEISGIIRAIKDEVKVKDDVQEETGRLEVEIYSFDNNGNASPSNLIVENDLADDFKDMYSNGDSCKLYYEILTKQVGGKKPQVGGGFGRRETKVVSGFQITEYSVFKGEEKFEDDSAYFISIDTMKTAMEARNTMIAQKIKEAKDGGAKPKDTKAKGLGSKQPKMEVEEEDMDSCPF